MHRDLLKVHEAQEDVDQIVNIGSVAKIWNHEDSTIILTFQ